MHFTYESPNGDLAQGDLLQITPTLRGLLREVHPRYSDHPDYAYLLVLTQTCDLERRNGQGAKARYISLAAVRPLDTLVTRELDEKHRRTSLERNNGLCAQERRNYFRDFLIKLLNNNAPEYFYLAEEPRLEITEPHVAFLALSIAIRLREHYDKCIEARFAQLTDLFRAKLGWLTGNIYSRVATPDWVPNARTQDEFDELLDQLTDRYSVWAPERAIARIRDEEKRRKRQGGPGSTLNQDEVFSLLEEYAAQQESRKSELVTYVVGQAGDSMKITDQNKLSTFRNRLLNSEKLDRFFP